jgi:hypothetical protein
MIFVCWLVIVAMPTKNGPKFGIPESITETLLLYSGITEGSTSASPRQTKLSNPQQQRGGGGDRNSQIKKFLKNTLFGRMTGNIRKLSIELLSQPSFRIAENKYCWPEE